jgi:3-deoxy-D-manno-octulosonate 8-phosphate phosphatase (KDO 8-P phosphatase)
MIKLIVTDVDGTLTDGKITYDSNSEEKSFNIKDGLILKAVQSLGIDVVLLTGRKSEAAERRAMELGADIIQGCTDKTAALSEYLSSKEITLSETAYFGDDINDYQAMKICGVKAAPYDAVKEIKDIADFVSAKKGGEGAVRDGIEYILKSEGRWSAILSQFGL